MTTLELAKTNPRAVVIIGFLLSSGAIGGAKFAISQAETLNRLDRNMTIMKDAFYRIPEMKKALDEAAAERDAKERAFK